MPIDRKGRAPYNPLQGLLIDNYLVLQKRKADNFDAQPTHKICTIKLLLLV